MKLLFSFYLFIIVINSILFANGQSLKKDEYSCMIILITNTNKLQDSQFLGVYNNTTKTYNFCNMTFNQYIPTCSSETQPDGTVLTYLNAISLTNTVSSTNVITLNNSNFNCFDRLNTLELNSYKISGTDFYGTTKTIAQSIRLINCTNVGIPTTFNSSLSSFYLEMSEPLTNLNGSISSSVFTNLKSFVIIAPTTIPAAFIYPTIKIDPIQNFPNLDNFKFTTTTIPNLTTFSIKNLEIILTSNFQIENLNTFINVKNIILDVLYSEIYFPTLLTSIENNVESFVLKSKLSQPTNYIDISISKKLKSFTFGQKSTPAIPFVYPITTGGFPINNFPDSLEQLDFQNAGVKTIANNIFKNLKIINLSSNSITGSLPNNNQFPKLTKLSLKANQYSGTIPPTQYCNVLLDLSNNEGLTGDLPECFSCYYSYQRELIKSSFFVGTKLNQSVPCTLKPIPNLIIGSDGYFTLYGDTLGYQLPTSYPSGVLTEMVTPNKLFIGQLPNSYIGSLLNFVFMGTNYTFATTPTTPIINLVSSIDLNSGVLKYTFDGSYFSYNSSDISITIGGNNCVIESSSFSRVICTAPSTGNSISLPDLKSLMVVYFSVSDLTTQITVTPGSINAITYCQSQCLNNGICITSTGTCKCQDGFSGYNCSVAPLSCPSNCNGDHGTCNTLTGVCICKSEWQSYDCGTPYIQCLINCNNGECNYTKGTCECFSGFTGIDCTIRDLDCSGNCSYPNGSCNRPTGYCNCLPGYLKEDCSFKAKTCPNDCTSQNNGNCDFLTGICACKNGYQSKDCSVTYKDCTSDCSHPNGGGSCNNVTGTCNCNSDYTGNNCNIPSQYISSIEPTNSDGGLVKIYGWFGTVNDGLTVKIGSLNCTVISFNSSYISCQVGGDTGTKSVTIVQNGIPYTGVNIYHYSEISYKCSGDCSGHGDCNIKVGQCKCYPGWGGFDCNSIKSSTSQSTSTTTTTSSSTTGSPTTPEPTSEPVIIPPTETTINITTAAAIINNQKTSYQIKITSLVEIGFNQEIIKTNQLQNQWDVDTSKSNKYIFSQTLNGTNCLITYSIEELIENRDYTFADLDLTLEKDSIKITVEIKDYPYSSSLNTLQLQMESKIGTSDTNEDGGECNQAETSVDTKQMDKNQLLNYITISKDSKVFYGRFVNRVISDTKPTFITTSIVSNNSSSPDSVIIGVNLPHCKSCLIDPDFSVLVSNSFKKCVDGKLVDENGKASWVLPVAIVVPCVTVVGAIIAGAIVYSKNRTSINIAKEKYTFKLRGLSKKNKDELYMPNK